LFVRKLCARLVYFWEYSTSRLLLTEATLTAETAREMSLGFNLSLQEPREVLFWQLHMLQIH